MLCLYLLAARSGRTEYDHHRAKHAVGELSVMEKIEGTYLTVQNHGFMVHSHRRALTNDCWHMCALRQS